MTKLARHFSLLAILVLFLSSCNLPTNADTLADPNAVFTAAAQTAAVQLTQASLNNPQLIPSATRPPLSPPTLAPTMTPNLPTMTPTDICDKADFIADVTIPDGTIFAPGETFTKTWRVKNIGTCVWTPSYALVFDNGSAMNGITQSLAGNVAPGDTVELSVNLTAPAADGDYIGNWQIRNAANVLFAKVYVQIKVQSAVFAVTSVNEIEAFSIAGHGISLSANVTANNAGTVQYHWILRETGHADIATSVENLAFAQAETKAAGALWAGCPHTGNFTAYLYIDAPNHQEFGSVDFACP